MRRGFHALVGFALACCALAPVGAFAQASAGKRVALVVGNSDYRHIPGLRHADEDAGDVASALERNGFEVTRLVNADLDALRGAVAGFQRSATGAEAAVMFYSGHALRFRGDAFLVPVTATLKDDTSYEWDNLHLTQVIDALSRARTAFLLVEGCGVGGLVNALTRRDGVVIPGVGDVQPRGAMMVAISTATTGETCDAPARNALFTGSLLAEIDRPGLNAAGLFQRVREIVAHRGGGRQTVDVASTLPAQASLVPADAPGHAFRRLGADPAAGPMRAYIERFGDHPLTGVVRTMIAQREQIPGGGRADPWRGQLDDRWQRARQEKARAARHSALEARWSREDADRQAELAAAERRRVEQERLERERLEREEQARIARAQEEERRRQAEIAEAERRRQEQERLAREAAEREEQARIARAQEEERRRQAEIAAAERRRQEQERLAREAAERQERLARETAEREERDRVARAQDEERKRQIEVAQAERRRQEQEKADREKAERDERARLVREQEEQRRRQAELAAAERKRQEQEKADRERTEREDRIRLAREQEEQRRRQADLDAQRRVAVAAVAPTDPSLTPTAPPPATPVIVPPPAPVVRTIPTDPAPVPVAGQAVDEANRFTADQRRLAQERLERERRSRPGDPEFSTPLPSEGQPSAAPNPVVAALPPTPAVPPAKTDTPELIKTAQEELKRLGCYGGVVHGRMNNGTKAALENAAKRIGAGFAAQPVSEDAVKQLRGRQGTLCVAARPVAREEEDERPARRPSIRREAPAPRVARPAAQPRSSGGCFTFNGRQFCQ